MAIALDAKVFRVGECQKALDRACKKVGIDRITHHDLRHLFATRCIESLWKGKLFVLVNERLSPDGNSQPVLAGRIQ